MKTEVLISNVKQENPEVQCGYNDMRMIFKNMDASARNTFCSEAMLQFLDNSIEEDNDYIKGIKNCINEEYENLVRNGLSV